MNKHDFREKKNIIGFFFRQSIYKFIDELFIIIGLYTIKLQILWKK